MVLAACGRSNQTSGSSNSESHAPVTDWRIEDARAKILNKLDETQTKISNQFRFEAPDKVNEITEILNSLKSKIRSYQAVSYEDLISYTDRQLSIIEADYRSKLIKSR